VTAPVTILAVEDDEVMAQLYRAVLERPGWNLVVCPTLGDATAKFDQHDVSLVLLDLVLPDGDARGWLAALRARPEHASRSVIVIAGTSDESIHAACYELGAEVVLEKPVGPAVLAAAVTGALHRAAMRAGGSPRGREAAKPDGPPSSRAVLLAEDDDVVAAIVEHRLGRDGFQVLRATDGNAALDIARATPICMAILDVMIPGIDGFELLAELRRSPATARVPVVMLTGLGGEREVERALTLGADDYVLKPFSPVELTARLNRLLRR
jgi:DNA-binding response OmpR family regulator